MHGNACAISKLSCRQCGRIDQTTEVQAITRSQAITKQNDENIDQIDKPSISQCEQTIDEPWLQNWDYDT